MPRFPTFLPALLLLALPALADPGIAPAPDSGVRLSRIADRAFAGSSVNVVANIRQSVFTAGGTRYAGYYDADGFMVLAKLAAGADRWETSRTEYRGHVADAHNSISLAVDGDGFLHVSWDHHVNPLNYARGVAPGSLELGPKAPMTGERETHVTYPQFFRLPGGDLLFLYRDGSSGRGNLILNRYATASRRWATVQPNLIDGEGRRSPYWGMATDARGTLHLAWIWRDSPDVATNHDIAYARSTDGGQSWTRADGTPCPLPIDAASAGYAVRIPTGSNLINSPFVTADADGRPFIVTYWSPAPGAAPQFHLVHHDGAAWTVSRIDHPLTRFELSGPGTRRPPISRGILLLGARRDGRQPAHLVYRDDSRGGGILAVSTDRPDAGPWKVRALTAGNVGAWEPAYDPAAWEDHGELAMLVQRVVQRDGDDRNPPPAEPTPIDLLLWQPR